ncbi:MAG: DUF4386 domain-containing protein [candidate division WOR-3 bacterium]|jgi:hypothetical protein
MTNRISETSLRSSATIAGFGYLIIFITGIFANFFVLQSLIVPGDVSATANNIVANVLLFRFGILGFVVMVVFDVVLVWALYVLLKPVSKSISLFSAWFRLVNATIFGVALYNLFVVAQLTSGADYLNALDPGQLHARVMLSLNTFDYTWLIGLIFFGVHLLFLGYLILKSGYIPKILGILLIIAGVGYLVDSLANILLVNYENYAGILAMIVFVPAFVGELVFMLWLLIKGGKISEITPEIH